MITSIALLAWLTPPAYAAAVGAECRDWSSRHNRADFELYDDAELTAVADRVRTVTIPWLPSPYEGFTLPGLVVTSRPENGKHRHHELVHARQWEERGLIGQSWHYLFEWHIGRLHGCSAHDAYLAIAAEQHARAHEPQRLLTSAKIVQARIIAAQLGSAAGAMTDADDASPSRPSQSTSSSTGPP